MASSRHVALGLAWVALAAGCGGGGDADRAAADTSQLARAERSLQSELEAAVEHLGMPAQDGMRVAPTRCDDRARADVTSGYRLRLKMGDGDTEELLRRAAGFWRERGRQVRVVGAKGTLPGGVRDRRPGLDVLAPALPRARRGAALRRHALPARPQGVTATPDTLGRVDERALAERLITYDTSNIDGLRAAAGFVKGWLEAREIDVADHDFNGLPVLTAEIGPPDAPAIVLHGHLDVVPGRPEQFQPRVEGDRLIGRGAYDMKGALAAMMCSLHDVAAESQMRVRFLCAPDEESEDIDTRSTDQMVRDGFVGDFAITGEPTGLHVGIQAKGVLACRIVVSGRAAHGSTPWLGDNAVLKAIDVFRRIETLPFSRESSELFDRPSINLGRIQGGDALNKVPDECTMVVDIRYLPNQDPGDILEQIRGIPDIDIPKMFIRKPAYVSRSNPYVMALCDVAARLTSGESLSVGRDGASDAGSFLEAGVPAVEFGPDGAGHHGPDEWVSVISLARYRQALGDFIRHLPEGLERADDAVPRIRAVEGGLS